MPTMPTPTDITAGTISISGTTVTGVGTGFAASDIRQGDLFIWIEGGDGFQAPIVASVESNTSLTLEEPWEGPAISGARYRLRYQWDSSRVSAQSRQLIDTLGDGKLQSLAGLAGGADTLPYFTGPSVMGQTGLSAYIRTLLDDADAASAQDTLGISALLGASGIGQTGTLADVTNLNTHTLGGLFTFSSTATGSPPTGTTGTLIHMNRSAGNSTQIAVTIAGADADTWVRRQSGGTWSAWRPVTPQVISNANGVAWRFASGLQICVQFSAFSVAVETSGGGSFNGTVSWTFPAPFASGAQVNAFSISGSTTRWGGNATGVSATGCTLRHFSSVSSATPSNLYGIAIGQY